MQSHIVFKQFWSNILSEENCLTALSRLQLSTSLLSYFYRASLTKTNNAAQSKLAWLNNPQLQRAFFNPTISLTS